ncbi:MAG: endonuclease/exonuclease/phosphatase family protein [Bacteroidota bacterium]
MRARSDLLIVLRPTGVAFLASMLVLVTLGSSCQRAETPATLRAMAYNIRFNNPGDSLHAWPNRRNDVAALIRYHNPDVMGLQEALTGQVAELDSLLHDYAWFGVGRDDGEAAGEYVPIFYRTSRLEPLDQGHFWLSETPAVPGSVSWDAAITRMVTWGHFRDRSTGQALYVFNTHFDHVGTEARLQSAQLLVDRLQEMAEGVPVVVTGDFNVTPSAPPYATLTSVLTDTFNAAADGHHGPTGTFSGFTVNAPVSARRIDYVFVQGPIEVQRHAILSDHTDLGYPSDHLPVVADLRIGS